MKRIYLFFLFVLSLLVNNKLIAQDKFLIDSLKRSLKVAENDTLKANLYYALSKAYWNSDPKQALFFANKTLSLSKKIGYKKGIGNAFNSMGAIYMFKGDYIPAMELFQKSLTIRKKIKDMQGVAWSYNNIGNIYSDQGNFSEALKNYIASLKIRDEIDDKNGIAASYNNIGNIYNKLGKNEEAIKNYEASLKIRKSIGYNGGIAECYGNIGSVYLKQNNYNEALKNQYAALKIFTTIEDKSGIAITYSLIGDINDRLGKYEESLKNYNDALKIYEEFEDKDLIAGSYNRIGNILTKQGNFTKAQEYLNRALIISEEIGSIENIKYGYGILTVLDSSMGNYKKALWDHKQYVYYRDSLINKENSKRIIQLQMEYDFDKKISLTKAAQEKKDAISRQLTIGLLVGLFAMLIFAVVFLIQRNKISKQKKKSDALLLNILPSEVANELKLKGHSEAKTFHNVTVMFTDFKDFTKVSEHISPEALVLELHTCFSAFDEILQKYKIEKIKTIGDAYMCVSGMPHLNPSHAKDMANAALDIMHFMNQRAKDKLERGEFCFEIRIGLNTGNVVAGIVGIKKFSYDIWGDTVNVASRMENSSESNKINISGSTYELVKNDFKCEYRGKINAKNKGEIDMYFLYEKENTA
jgi:adenylate cyclase